MRRIFIGMDGLRAGWKVLLFFALFVAVTLCLGPLARLAGKGNLKLPVPPDRALLHEFIGMLAVLIATGIMAKWVDRKPGGYFGMPLHNAFRSTFWVGAVVGVGVLALQLGIMHVFGWFDFGTLQTRGAAIVGYGLIWALMFLCVAVTEEGVLRGYVQRVTTNGLSALAGGWSFWLSALLYSVIFACGHLGNPGENKFGISMVFVDGLTMCFSLWRTGDLWFAIGNHAAWDWGQTFLFGTPDSGMHGQHALMAPSFHGPALWSGRTDGPEASVLALLSEALIVLSVALIYRRRKFQLVTDDCESQVSSLEGRGDESVAGIERLPHCS
ncbi:MAG: CPBP family intramembrane metalloprotease [Acidobacteriaceae bacterium]|nr:CPBP family intramembrane metalloprotease [Acidobacteriaceae bacterium]